jgi:uracil-DNA glycosylase family 4
MAESKMERLEILRAEVKNLILSPLYPHRQALHLSPVFGEGSSDARLMFISAAPGKQDAEQGRPMVGPSGRILDSLLESIHLRRHDVYITNIVKDYSPGRAPSTQEIEMYAPFLEGEIDIIRPGVLAALGRSAAAFLLRRFGLDETERPAAAQTTYGTVHIVPLAHPAVALYNRAEMETMRAAFRQLAGLLASSG